MFTVAANDFDLATIAQSGQCFRMRHCKNGGYFVAAGNRLVTVLRRSDGAYEFSCSEDEFASFWCGYFDLDTDYGPYYDALDPQDVFLAGAASYGRGMRILRQDPWETAVSFVLSQRKNIAAIRHCIHALCQACGTAMPTAEGMAYAFPTPEQILHLKHEALQACSVGYRGKYVKDLALRVCRGDLDLDAVAGLDDRDAKASLMRVHGIGEKVADCILLFGYHRMDAFPMDVWMRRVTDGVYAGGWDRQRYRGFSGLVQQLLFHYARNEAAKGCRIG